MNIPQLTLAKLAQIGKHQSGSQVVPGSVPSRGNIFSKFILLFLGGLSLHLNHLIGSCVTNYDWPFGTLPFGILGSNLDTRDLETYPRTYSGHF